MGLDLDERRRALDIGLSVLALGVDLGRLRHALGPDTSRSIRPSRWGPAPEPVEEAHHWRSAPEPVDEAHR